MPYQWVWFLSPSGLKKGLQFEQYDLKSGGFQGNQGGVIIEAFVFQLKLQNK